MAFVVYNEVLLIGTKQLLITIGVWLICDDFTFGIFQSLKLNMRKVIVCNVQPCNFV